MARMAPGGGDRMSMTRIRLPFARSSSDEGAETAKEMLQVAYLQQDAPTAPHGTRVGVHITCIGGEGKGVLGIQELVLDALEGIAWHSTAKQVDSVVVGLTACERGETPCTDILIYRED